MRMTVSTRERGGYVIVGVTGCLDLTTAPHLRVTLLRLLRGSHARIVVDLAEVDHCDPAGLAVLVGALKRARAAGGSLCLVSLSPPAHSLLHATGLHRVLTVHDSVDHAIGGALPLGA